MAIALLSNFINEPVLIDSVITKAMPSLFILNIKEVETTTI